MVLAFAAACLGLPPNCFLFEYVQVQLLTFSSVVRVRTGNEKGLARHLSPPMGGWFGGTISCFLFPFLLFVPFPGTRRSRGPSLGYFPFRLGFQNRVTLHAESFGFLVWWAFSLGVLLREVRGVHGAGVCCGLLGSPS